MKIVKNILAVIGAIYLVATFLAMCWWNGFIGTPLELDLEPEKNPARTRIGHLQLSPDDKIIFQDENYDGFFGDGGGVVVAKLGRPMTYDPESWVSIEKLPPEIRAFLGFTNKGAEHLEPVLHDPETIWCLSKLQRNGEHISNIVLFFYRPSEQTMLEWILHT